MQVSVFALHYVDGSSPKVEEIIIVSSAVDILPHECRFFQKHSLQRRYVKRLRQLFPPSVFIYFFSVPTSTVCVPGPWAVTSFQ